MRPNLHINDFLDPVNLQELSGDQGYRDGQIGKLIDAHDEFFPDLFEADMVILGCEGSKGAARKDQQPADVIRQEFYQLFYWHPELKLADAGNIRSGATHADTRPP